MTIKECDLCGKHAAQHMTRLAEYEYKGHSFTIDQPADWCDACGEAVINPEDLKASAAAIQTQKSLIDGLLTPAQVKSIRTFLGITQKEAGEIFGGGVNAFSRYENGINPTPRAVGLALRLARNDIDAFKKTIEEVDVSVQDDLTEQAGRL